MNTREESKEKVAERWKWRAQHPDYYLIKVNCPLCNKVVSKRNLTRHQRSDNCKKLQHKEFLLTHKTHIILVSKNTYLIYAINVGRGQMSLRFHTNRKHVINVRMLLDNITEINKSSDYKEKIACPACVAMCSRVRMESHINLSFCKYNAMLANSKTTQSLTYRRDDGSLWNCSLWLL